MSSRRVDFEEREYYREAPRRPSRPPPVREYDDDVEIRIENDRVPKFMREERRPTESGALVIRQRDVETFERERPRRRSPSPLRVQQIRRARSVSPAPPRRVEEEIRIRQVEKAREPSRERVRIVERERRRSPSPVVRERIQISERRRSPSPVVRERIQITRKEKERSPSPPPREVIKGPVIEREVITHYRDIDHGVIVARAPTPSPPPPPRRRERETDIDIYTSRKETEVDIHRGRSRSRERHRPSRAYDDDDLFIHAQTQNLHVDVSRNRSTSRRRAHSAAPPVIQHDDDEGRAITRKIESRGKMGEAWGGVTQDWAIIDVPPGTERVRMDGAGGGQAEVTWSKYSGVRRAKFIPERDERRDDRREESRGRAESRSRGERDSRLSVQIYDSKDRDREREVERVTDRRLSIRASAPAPPSPRGNEMWTEITKDLVTREAIERMGYEYEETEWFYYVMEYLHYDDVLQLVQMSDSIRRARKERAREIQWEREWREEWERSRHQHHHHHSHSRSKHRHPDDRYDDEHVVETEVVYDRRPSRKHYY
ncbi:hypothetical protein V8F33_001162 [Rhypophila sp. PSN 637]